jgi:hypothetical protein
VGNFLVILGPVPSSAVPPPIASDLGASESVLLVLPARLAPSPAAKEAIGGALILTSDRLALVPGAEPPAPRPSDPAGAILHDLWRLVRPAIVDAFPLARLFAARHASGIPLAGRGRPGIEVPLQVVRRAFLAGAAPGWVGVEVALPPPDVRPPFALYLHAGDRAAELEAALVRHRPGAPPRPDLERPYALFYLFRPPPQIFVRTGDRAGLLELGADGPTLRKGSRADTIVPYESVTAVEVAPDRGLRRGEVRLRSDDVVHVLRASRTALPRLLDVGHLVAEVAGVPARLVTGPVAGGRVAWRATWLGAAGAAAFELARLFFT